MPNGSAAAAVEWSNAMQDAQAGWVQIGPANHK